MQSRATMKPHALGHQFVPLLPGKLASPLTGRFLHQALSRPPHPSQYPYMEARVLWIPSLPPSIPSGITGEPLVSTWIYVILTATTQPLTFLPEHGLWQDVAFFLWSRQFDFLIWDLGVLSFSVAAAHSRGSFLSFLKAHVPAAQGTASSHPPTVGTQALFFFSRPACHPTVRNPSSLLAVDLFTHRLSQLHRNNSTTPKAWLLRYDLTV